MFSLRRRRRAGKTAAWTLSAAGLAAAAVVFALAGCGNAAGSKRDTPAAPAKPLTLSAWVVDWQWEAGLKDFDEIAAGLDSVQAFAAYFNEDGGLHFTETDRLELPAVLGAAKRSGVGVQLTVVNDRYAADGSPALEKDPALITGLMATETSRGKHMGELLDAVGRDGFDGLELDYERVPNGAWSGYSRFIGDLYARLHAEGKTLRVVLEARAPIEKLDLPEGPDYVMMAYNLYGGFSGPGPKADDAFIARLAARMDALPGKQAIALSLGGFDWTADRQATSVTEAQAAALAGGGSAEKAVRDDASGSLHFRYTDGDGAAHTVWYADAETLKRWIGVARNAGADKVALWRLGGLSAETRTLIKEWQP